MPDLLKQITDELLQELNTCGGGQNWAPVPGRYYVDSRDSVTSQFHDRSSVYPDRYIMFSMLGRKRYFVTIEDFNRYYEESIASAFN